MQKYWGVLLALVVIVSCKEEEKPIITEIAQIEVEKPVEKYFGFKNMPSLSIWIVLDIQSIHLMYSLFPILCNIIKTGISNR